MTRLTALPTFVRLAVGVLLLAIGLRTWLVMGLIEPVLVSGSSMAPGLRGTFATAPCPSCNAPIDIAAEYIDQSSRMICSACGEKDFPLTNLSLRHGDRLWIDRTTFLRRKPRRWETVVLINPDNASQLCVKRVVGLPGETVEIRDGDIWINGKVLTKPLSVQHTLRVPIQCDGSLLTDDLAYNAGLSRKLELVQDFMLTGKLQIEGTGSITIKFHDGQSVFFITITQPDGVLKLIENDVPIVQQSLSPRSSKRLDRGEVLFECSNFDRQLLVALDGHVELRWPILGTSEPEGTSEPFRIEASGENVHFVEQIIYRDVHYLPQAVGTLPNQQPATRLAEDEYFLLGDNSPVSLDSRLWGPVPAKWLIGTPILAR